MSADKYKHAIESSKKYALSNKERITENRKKWKKSKKYLDYLNKTLEHRRIIQLEYARKNRHSINKKIKNRYYSNPRFKIAQNLRTRIRLALNGVCKSKSTRELLGADFDFVKSYLESQFKPGMSWENHRIDGWHIDHKKPCALFDLTNPEQQKECFHYSNLQPLWAKDNFIKNKKYDHKMQT